MKKIALLSSSLVLIILLSLFASLLSMAQTSDEEEEPRFSFRIDSEIGRALPRKIIYDPNFERYAVVDAYNRLLLVDALTFETQHVLYETGQFNDILFSNDGNWFALAIAQRIELYDANTGELVSQLTDLSSALSVVGPLAFSRDDTLLKFEGVYPVPRALRVRENQTQNVPWLWNLTAARNEGDSTFPRNLEAWQFFDYRNGFVLGPNDQIVAALPARLQVVDAYTLEQRFDIPTDRYEADPLRVWTSLRDDKIYVRPTNENSLIQVDTDRQILAETPLNQPLTETDLELLSGIELSAQAKVIGGSNTAALKQAFLGNTRTQRDRYDTGDLAVTLIDLILPPAQSEDNVVAFLYIYNERTEIGWFEMRTAGSQMILNPDETELYVRTRGDNERIIAYDIATGAERRRLTPSLRAIGAYSRNNKNRVLAFNATGDVLISDFQRYDVDSFDVLAEDLRYSRRFDRFFFTQDSANIITMSGNEWRVWNRETGEVLRREVLNLNGNIIRDSNDGFQFLTRFTTRIGQTGVEIVDLQNTDDASYNNVGDGVTRQSVLFDMVRGSGVDLVIPSPDWQHYLVTYTINSFGDYAPGNQIAMYSISEGLLWFIAGDDLPPPNERNYGWIDNETVYVYGTGYNIDQPSRVFGADYDVTGLPQCIVDRFPERVGEWVNLWERLVYRLRNDQLHDLTLRICADVPDTIAEAETFLIPTATPIPVTLTPIRIEGVPVCLTARYPNETEQYAQLWRDIIDGLNADEIAEAESLICEGIGEIPERYASSQGEFIEQSMLIEARTGVRSTGGFQPMQTSSISTEPIRLEFEKQTKRSLGQFVISPDRDLVASSSLPGELVVYELVTSFETLMGEATATAQVRTNQRNLMGAAPSFTPTFNPVGTPRPTLTPTTTPTLLPNPDQTLDLPQFGETLDLCPAETLFTIDNPPESYTPNGMIIGSVSGDFLWTVNPITGVRASDETIPPCGEGVNCNFSLDKEWILIVGENVAYAIRPDGTDNRGLFGSDDPEEFVYVPPMEWIAGDVLEYPVQIEVQDEFGRTRFVDAIQWNIIGVFPDPDPWIPFAEVNELPTTILTRQNNGQLAVVRTEYSTGVAIAYKYYLYNMRTGEYEFFAQSERTDAQFQWLPFGERLVYTLNANDRTPFYYMWSEDTGFQSLGRNVYRGTMSTDGRYFASSTSRRAQPIAIFDSQTGLTRTYCLPETGARLYNGGFEFSPDSRYVALRAFLPKDEDVEGVGQHLLILNIETGEVVDLTTGFNNIVVWAKDFGTYGESE